MYRNLFDANLFSFRVLNQDFPIRLFPRTAGSSAVTDAITCYVTHRIFNVNHTVLCASFTLYVLITSWYLAKLFGLPCIQSTKTSKCLTKHNLASTAKKCSELCINHASLADTSTQRIGLLVA